MAPTLITPASLKRRQKNLREAAKDLAVARRAALAKIAAARAAGHHGRIVLAREDACGEYMNARHYLSQQHAQLRDVQVLG